MDWTSLLSDHRCPRPGEDARPARPEPHRTSFEADWDRVVYSAPFRRLGRKTQVHPMAAHDHVHNRLTHSLEVASVGRSFAKRLARFLRDQGEAEADRGHEIAEVVQAACLAHDIGNPPFGHAGEFAIREWVREHAERLFAAERGEVDPGTRADVGLFEGNAQGFRLAARADNPETGYMRLTYATLGAMVKYPWTSEDERAGRDGKFNVFSAEKELFEGMARETGLADGRGAVARHPLSFLSEAADDICYRLLDLEDAVEMGILAEDEVRATFLEFPGMEELTDRPPLALVRGQVVERLVEACWGVFESNYGAIMAGERGQALKADLSAGATDWLERVKEHYERIFGHRAKVATELGAYEALGRIMDTLTHATAALAEAGDLERVDFLTGRRLQLAWDREYLRSNQGRGYAWWLHQVMDYVAGLTDNYARQLAREIAGQ